MRVELDHVFVCSAPGAPEADLLVAFGLAEGTETRSRRKAATSLPRSSLNGGTTAQPVSRPSVLTSEGR